MAIIIHPIFFKKFLFINNILINKNMTEHLETHILAKFKVLKKIGSGAYGHVYKVIDNKDKKVKALKKNFDAFNNSTDAQRTYREIMFLM